MNLFTHLAISKILYNHFNERIKLDRSAFIYGNIKPDLSYKVIKKSHLVENYFTFVCSSSGELMKNEKDLEEFSIELGQICHYVCDFFCRYHLDKEVFHNLGNHFLYELRLQYELWKLTRKDKCALDLHSRKARRDIASIIFQMRSDYFSESVTLKKDINYAILTTIWVCESISHFLAQSAEPAFESESGFYTMLPLAGGQ